jgi:hypothetical protein
MWTIKAKNKKEQFLVIEPSFYDVLEPCDGATIKYLEILRRKLPLHFRSFPEGIKFGLIRYGDFFRT